MDFTTIIVHLDQYFSDQRKCSKLYIDDRFTNINDLQEYIKRVFNIHSSFCLLDLSGIPNFLLPRSEDIRILSGITNIMVQKVEKNFEINLDISKPIACNENWDINVATNSISPIKRSSTLRLNQENSLPNGVQILDNARKTSEKFTIISDVVIKPKDEMANHETSKQISDEQLPEPLADEVDENNLNTTNNPAGITFNCVEKSHLTPIMETSEVRYSNDIEMDTNCKGDSSICEDDPSLIDDDNITTRGRKRIRKRKRTLRTLTPGTPVSLPREVTLLRKAVESSNGRSSRASHIRFDENDDLESTISASFNSTLNNSNLNNSNCENSQLSSTLANGTRLTNIVKKAKIVQGFCKENTIVNQENLEETTDNAWENLCKNFNPNEFPNLMNLPEQDDIIGFRMLKMTDSYEPELSKYIFGMVLEIEKNPQIGDSDLTIQVLAGFENCTQPTGKFALPEDDSNENNPDNVNLTLKWMNVIEPKKIV